MIPYTYKVNEEIARWVTEVFIKSHPENNWWIAFTNPTAGPWKKIVARDENGIEIEVYRFEREAERPDLILVNDESQTILIVEAKDFLSKLITDSQMKKSIRVINDMTRVLSSLESEHWDSRKDYTIIPSFLWFCEQSNNIRNEDRDVRSSYSNNCGENSDSIINIIVTEEDGVLKNNFVTNSQITANLEV